MACLQHGRSIIRRGSGASLPNPLLFGAQGVRYKKLEVILTSPIHKLGKSGDTVKVKPGFFRNHLMPKFLAVPNTDKFAFLVKEQREAYEPKEVEEVKVSRPKTEEDKMREYQAAARRLDSSTLVLRKFTLSEEEMRDPVTKDEIVAEVARQLSVRIEPQNLYLPNPLISFGEFEVPLRLPRSIPLPDGKLQWGLNVKIRRK